MADLKLKMLPDRTPVKLTIQLLPELADALNAYAAVYEASYGRAEAVADLVPAILASFIESDREFRKARANDEAR